MLDFQDVVVQIFTEEQREHYNLDGYYSMAKVRQSPAVLELLVHCLPVSAAGTESEQALPVQGLNCDWNAAMTVLLTKFQEGVCAGCRAALP